MLHDLTRSLLLAAHQQSADEGPSAAAASSGAAEAAAPAPPALRPSRLDVSSLPLSLGDSDQAVRDLLLLASPQHSQLPLSSSSVHWAGASSRRRRSSDEGWREGGAEEAEEARRKRIKRDAMAEVHKAMQMAAQAQTQPQLSNGAPTICPRLGEGAQPSPSAGSDSREGDGDPLLCTERSAEPTARPPAAEGGADSAALTTATEAAMADVEDGEAAEDEGGQTEEAAEQKRGSSAGEARKLPGGPLKALQLSPALPSLPAPPSSPPRLAPSAVTSPPSASSSTLTEFATFLKRMLAQRARDDYTAAPPSSHLALCTPHPHSSLTPVTQPQQETRT